MLMPIVSMNKMAMNESVAATCCYHEKASPTNVYWEVLNGGWIGSGYVELKNYDKFNADDNGWLKYTHDIKDTWASGTLPVLSKTLAGTWVVNMNQNYISSLVPVDLIWDSKAGADDAWYSLSDWLTYKGTGMRDATCSHNDSTCYYFLSDIQHKSNQHFQATTKHSVPTSGQSWNLPHDVGQFNS